MSNRYYVVEVYDSLELLFQCEIPIGQIGRRKLEALVRALAVKHGLSNEEVADAYLNRNTRKYLPLLEVQRMGGQRFGLMCGENPYVAVRVEER